jgi:hypothetical protein
VRVNATQSVGLGWYALALLATLGACKREAPSVPAPPIPPPLAAAVPANVPVPAPTPTPVAAPPTRQEAEALLATLAEILKPAAGDPANPWALAHGLLAFGPEFAARDGRSAIDVILSFSRDDAFAIERDGQIVEPHPYLFVKTFSELGVKARPQIAALRAKMLADTTAPTSDAEWHQYAWRLDATCMHLTRAGATQAEQARATQLLSAALARLEQDDAVLAEPPPGHDAFAPDQPMGAAKRNKTAIYGHPCGGMHFTQAVFRALGTPAANAELRQRGRAQLRRLLVRYRAERALYASSLAAHPEVERILLAQQLKFFGHLLEVLATADAVQVVGDDAAMADELRSVRLQAAADLVATIRGLQSDGAYQQLAEIDGKNHQLFLDLIGDGCHATHGLRETLALLR